MQLLKKRYIQQTYFAICCTQSESSQGKACGVMGTPLHFQLPVTLHMNTRQHFPYVGCKASNSELEWLDVTTMGRYQQFAQ
jgi:hypothetical protein